MHRNPGATLRSSIVAVLILLSGGIGLPLHSHANQSPPMIILETSLGPITLEMYPEEAPMTVQNFIEYVESGFFDGIVFHRVIRNFMIQSGGHTPDMREKLTGKPILNEADNGLKNAAGTIAMARTADPHSATAQFFINLVDNDFLNHTAKTPRGWGYAVFGQVTEGMDVVRAIGEVATGQVGPHGDVPIKPVVIQKARVLTP